MTTSILVFSILILVFLAIHPLRIQKFSLNMITGSLLVIGALFALDIVTIETMRNGILGNENMQPWKILVIFFTVAYASVSTDITGIFDVIALKIVKIANTTL